MGVAGGGRGAVAGPFRRLGLDVVLDAAEERMVALAEEFERRARQRPDLVVRPWFSPGPADREGGRLGFVVEYCPDGRRTAELRVRRSRVTVEGGGVARDVRLSLAEGWRLGEEDAGSPETLVNHLLRLADAALGEAA